MIPGVDNLAAYKAPANIIANTTATVSLQLKSTHTLILVSNIKLQSNNWFEMRIGNGPWKSYEASAVQLDATKCSIAFIQNQERLSMFFPASKGTHGWDEVVGFGTAAFNYWPNGAATAYEANYTKDLGLFDSDGSVEITQYGAVGGFVEGTFTIDPAGYYNVSDSHQIGTYKIEGRFKLKRFQ
ncbi:MAG: hypothetical protein QM802_04920 [Agriterribacter sp.]